MRFEDCNFGECSSTGCSACVNGTGATKRDGIVTDDLEETLRNLGKLGNEGMSEANDEILKMLLDKKTTKMCG